MLNLGKNLALDNQILFRLLEVLLPSIIILILTYLIVDKFLVTEFKKKQLAIFKDNLQITMPLRLQAYERLVVFCERVHPRQLLSRTYVADVSAKTYSQILIANINTEFEHNLSQQVYVSNSAWQTVKAAKEQEITMIYQVLANLPDNASSADLQTKIVDFLKHSEVESPMDVALVILNEEAKKVLSLAD